MAVYITGDTHANFQRFNVQRFFEQQELTKNDYVIICGDFGGIWRENDISSENLNFLNTRSYTTLFVDGNHENYDLLNTFPVEEWHGGKVQFIKESVIHLMRGQIYEIDGETYFTMGGASSHDIQDGILELDDPEFREKKWCLDFSCGMYRINHVSWWKEELPSEEEYAEGVRNLEMHNWKVDNIITHCCPTSILKQISDGAYASDRLTDYFETIKTKTGFKRWFFGHYHDNRIMSEKFILLYKEIFSRQTENFLGW